MDAPRRILLVRLSHLGDVVHALPVFHALRAGFPEAELGWAVQPEFAELVAGLPGLDRVFLFERRGGFAAWPRLARELRAWGPDLAVDAQGNLKSAAVARVSGARRRVGLDASEWRERAGAWLTTERAPRTAPSLPHALDRAETLARHLAPGARPRHDPALTDEELARGRVRWESLGGAPRALLLHLADERDVRSWPASAFARLAREVAASGRRVLVVSGPAEAAAGREVERALGAHANVAHWVGQRGLRELAAVLACAAADGATLVACDSGPLHLAVACGLRTVCLSGPQDPRRTGPRPAPGVPGAFVRAEPAPECAPCLARRCTHAEGPVCMTRITPERVVAALGAE